ncbi:hypothetical protein [Brevibacillus porteri]|uniref:hypothetical protein n=1 Tax=Brevibacillus porteri TaxID=2126350 RepID=UPI003D25F6D8
MKTEVKAMFQDFNAGAKKDVIKFEVKGDLTDEQIVALHKLKGGSVFVQISSSQMDMDDIEGEEHEGIKYSINEDGTVSVPANQMTIDELPKEGQEKAETDTGGANPEETSGTDTEEDDQGEEVEKGASDLEELSSNPDNVADTVQEPKRRGRPRKKEPTDKPESQNELEQQQESPPGQTNDDDLPF